MKPPYKSELGARETPPPAVEEEESRRIHKNKRKPVVIYMVPPEVIHADASEFMGLVQRLTGPGSGGPAEEEAAPSARAPPSTSGRSGGRRRQTQQLPVRVKARAWNSGPEAEAGRALFFHDLSPPASAVQKDEQPPAVAPHSWLLHGEYLDQSPPRHEQGFLDVFGGQEQDRR